MSTVRLGDIALKDYWFSNSQRVATIPIPVLTSAKVLSSKTSCASWARAAERPALVRQPITVVTLFPVEVVDLVDAMSRVPTTQR